MESEEGDAKSILSGSLRESVEVMPDQDEPLATEVTEDELNREPDQNHFPCKAVVRGTIVL